MKIMTVGEFKAKFSNVIEDLLQGKEVGVSYGKKKEKIGVIVPFASYKKKRVRKLGIWKNKGSFKLAKDFKITEEEFLNLEG